MQSFNNLQRRKADEPLRERVVEAKAETTGEDNSGQQYCFSLVLLIQDFREGHKELHCVGAKELHRLFINLETDYDMVLREELWSCVRRQKRQGVM